VLYATDIRARVLAAFPARVIATSGVGVTKANGVFTFKQDIGGLVEQVDIPAADQDNVWMALWNSDTNAFVKVSAHNFFASVTGGNPSGVWIAWAPTLSTAGGSSTFVTNTARYFQQGKVVRAFIDVTVSAVGTGTGAVGVTLPVNAFNTGIAFAPAAFHGQETQNGWALSGTVAGAGTQGLIKKYDGTTPLGASNRLVGMFHYESV